MRLFGGVWCGVVKVSGSAHGPAWAFLTTCKTVTGYHSIQFLETSVCMITGISTSWIETASYPPPQDNEGAQRLDLGSLPFTLSAFRTPSLCYQWVGSSVISTLRSITSSGWVGYLAAAPKQQSWYTKRPVFIGEWLTRRNSLKLRAITRDY